MIPENDHENLSRESELLDIVGDYARSELVGSVHVAHDVTERHRAEERLKETMEAKSKFTSVVSHELRTPLTAMKESIGIVLDGSAGPVNEEQKDFLDTAKRNVERLARLINDVLDFQKLEAGKMQFRLEDNDIGGVIQELAKTMEPLVRERGLELKIKIEEGLPRFRFDRDKIIQVLTNFVNNAIKFTSKGHISIVVSKDADAIRVSVEDTGPGIKKEDLSKLFESFSQLGDSKDRRGGTGLGLAISKEIIQRHQGDVWVESEEGKGTKFIFLLYQYGVEKAIRRFIESRSGSADQASGFILYQIKIDGYKSLVDQYSQKKALDVVAKILEGLGYASRKEDVILQKGADEIIVIVGVARSMADQIGKRFKKAAKSAIYDILGAENKILFSYGLASYPEDGWDPKGLMDRLTQSLMSEEKERLKKNILIVDDEPEVVETLRKILSGLGYSHVFQANEGRQALESIAREAIEVVILDMVMPTMNGYEVIGRLKGNPRTRNIPVLIISGHEIKKDLLEGFMKEEAIPVIGKPFSMKELDKWLYFLL